MRPYLVLSIICLIAAPTFLFENGFGIDDMLNAGSIFMMLVGLVMSAVFYWIDRHKRKAG